MPDKINKFMNTKYNMEDTNIGALFVIENGYF